MISKPQLPRSIDASWLRSQHAGLSEQAAPTELRLSSSDLQQRHYQNQQLITLVERYAYPLFEQLMAHTSSRLILSDMDGYVIQYWGIERYSDKLANIALETGVNWLEQYKGTNAIGTAIATQKAVAVIGEQHFIKQHRFMSCTASPIFSPSGEMIAVLDITSEQQRHNQQTMHLSSSLAQQVETALLCQLPQSHYRIDLAAQAHLLNSGWQGIVVADSEGKIVGHNPMAQQLIKQLSIGESLAEHLGERWSSEGQSDKAKLHLHTRALKPSTAKYEVIHADSEQDFSLDPTVNKAWQHAVKVVSKSIPLLILGETGVGKERFVKRLHQQSQRSGKLLQAVNCAALPNELVEAELFGYQAGAFTGANPKGFIGKIRQADGGFLFLDEIGEMPLAAQCRLLRVLQEREVVPIGGNQAFPVDVQVVAATHVNLTEHVASDLFREDLYYRLNGLQICLPALRERSDRSQLLRQLHQRYCTNEQSIDLALFAKLLAYEWPGNMRELDNFMQVACLLTEQQSQLNWNDLPESLQKQLANLPLSSDSPPNDLKQTIDENIVSVYQRCQGNITKAAKQLGISRNTLYRKLRKLKLKR
ncbi:MULTISPECIES: sigma-54-dependent Fis family transcriptional regulator [unclassified Agarivorans]|uniref:sigma-54-dependent Fis family transcriptional regulator n=1 Tax=unclassified Agarivorans TaxID=2636026 RepID=UPI0026E203C0|nr:MULTISPECIES: sigma-54-dependent Fis family transcriptional regulator [unclassified Agarivorans]MDO6687638.1 sigma-54-dependent Fis family transcriptional regulator [Agarivorans sp. 3_MG-2023]MDO6717192.1 sigma-54-dependent Fis family transcriptional regulator [Agarivorans sp. 2_MG-2023]